MTIALITIFLILVCCAVFGIPMYAIVLVLAAIGAVAVTVFVLIWKEQKRLANNVVRAKLIEEVAVYKRVIEHTGFSIGFGWRSGRDYYRYKNVLDHYECVFRVIYKNGEEDTITCVKDSTLYNELIFKRPL